MFNLTPWRRKQSEHPIAPTTTEVTPLARLREEVDALFDRFWTQWPIATEALKGWPALVEGEEAAWGLEIDDRQDEVVVRAEAPGFDSNDFNVHLAAGHLVLEAEHKEEKEEEGRHTYRVGTLHRMIPVPAGVEKDKINATYRNGVLEVRMPKGEAARSKRIPVTSA